ncbi:hypothetical protein [Atribacter laminatus]|jgi:hypothetical protein|uniref:hypothetical protein n=1 Tax=Atribacter laminatus TaxID=2847778 RepID=UPI001C4075F2|nr:hypothetical protein [Atribacter laminatus]
MKKQGFLSRYLLLKPTIRVMFEWPILGFVGIFGEIFSWSKIPFSPFCEREIEMNSISFLLLQAQLIPFIKSRI